MSDHKLFANARANDLLQELQQPDKKKTSPKRKVAMKKVIANMTMGNHEMIGVFAEVMKCFESSSSDLEMKRMCYHYLTTYALAKPDLAIVLLSSVMDDLKSSSVTLQALALRSISSIPLKEYLTEAVKAIGRALDSPDVYIRKTAIFAVARVHEKDPKLTTALIESLYWCIDDENPAIVAATLTVFNDVCERGNHRPLNLKREQANRIAQLLPKIDEWSQIFVLDSLLSFVPQTHDEALMLIDKVVVMLQHSNSAVVLNALKVLVYLINFTDVIEEFLAKKLATSLTSLLSKPAEIQFLALRNVILLILSKPKLIPFDVTHFFCEYNDPIYVKDTKLEIIYLLANESNLDVVLGELEEYGTDVDVQMSRKAMRALGNLAVKLDAAAKRCVDVMLNLTDTGIDYVIQEAIITFKNVLRRYDTFDYLIPQILQFADTVEEPEARSALIWIVGQYCQLIPKAESVLADLIFTFAEDPYDVQLASLTACVKLFLREPEKGQKLVLKTLKYATEEVDNPDVRDRGYFYWRLLSSQDKYPGTAREIIDGEIPQISNENEQLDPVVLEELELNIATLASIYLKPVGQVFRLAKRKQLPPSPARSTPTTTSSTSSTRIRASTISSSTSDLSSVVQNQRHIDDYDVNAVNVNQVKKPSSLGRRLTMSKNSLTRKLSVRGFN